jgi:hypothetical protein
VLAAAGSDDILGIEKDWRLRVKRPLGIVADTAVTAGETSPAIVGIVRLERKPPSYYQFRN